MKLFSYLKIWRAWKKTQKQFKEDIKMEPKKWWTSKTLWFNAITGLLTVAGALQSSALAADPKVQAGCVLFITLGNAILRFMTDKPVQ